MVQPRTDDQELAIFFAESRVGRSLNSDFFRQLKSRDHHEMEGALDLAHLPLFRFK